MAIPSKSRAVHETRVTVNFSDSIDLIHDQINWSPKGVSLLTKWPFAEGKEIEFAFDHRGERHSCTGVVVACHPLRRPVGHFEIVLYFVETPCSRLQKAASDCRLARAEKLRRSEEGHVHSFNGAAPFAPGSRTGTRVE
jgi:hypothetical protein